MDEEKFVTQRQLTFTIVMLFSFVTIWSLFLGTVEQKSIIIQCVIGLMIAYTSYWIGATKGAADAREQMAKMLQPQPDSKITTTIETDPKP